LPFCYDLHFEILENKKRYKWHKIAEKESELNFAANNLLQMNVAGKTICIAKTGNGSLHACANKCPHAGGIISNGFIDALDNVICPLHRYKYSLRNGRNVSGQGYYLKIYPLTLLDDGIYVGIEERAFLSWF
jgi:3-phenylpropionate/trans-cinnamate dioxygenase ferredoxin subunit